VKGTVVIIEKLIEKIDQKDATQEVLSSPQSTSASLILELGGLAMRFARVERTPRYEDGRRESDVEHSYMLALVAPEVAHDLYPNEMNLGLISQYAIVHDLVEVVTGDIPTFQLDEQTLARKEANEQLALEKLLASLPPHTKKILAAYEAQTDKEARFVRATDKLLPIVTDIYGPGQRVMREDYDVTTSQQLHIAYERLRTRMQDRFGEFPGIITAYSLLSELFEIEFSATQQR